MTTADKPECNNKNIPPNTAALFFYSDFQCECVWVNANLCTSVYVLTIRTLSGGGGGMRTDSNRVGEKDRKGKWDVDESETIKCYQRYHGRRGSLVLVGRGVGFSNWTFCHFSLLGCILGGGFNLVLLFCGTGLCNSKQIHFCPEFGKDTKKYIHFSILPS